MNLLTSTYLGGLNKILHEWGVLAEKKGKKEVTSCTMFRENFHTPRIHQNRLRRRKSGFCTRDTLCSASLFLVAATARNARMFLCPKDMEYKWERKTKKSSINLCMRLFIIAWMTSPDEKPTLCQHCFVCSSSCGWYVCLSDSRITELISLWKWYSYRHERSNSYCQSDSFDKIFVGLLKRRPA